MKDIYILGIETSCDETSASIVKNGREVLSNIISSQIDLHKEYGGVVPEIASRKHVELIIPVINEAIRSSGIDKDMISAVGVTFGPGLIGALLVGLSAAKAMSYALNVPLVGVHHIEGHIAANFIEHKTLEPPFVSLVVSGGHSHIIECTDYGEFKIHGRTRDDAVGEAYDKIARTLGLGYPGGPIIDKMAKEGNAAVQFPRVHFDNLDFSFSGLKTAVINYVHNEKMRGNELYIPDICASFQSAVVDILVENTIRAAIQTGLGKIVLAGGVASNSSLRARMKEEASKKGMEVYIPSPILCTDNGAMIASAAYFAYVKGRKSKLDLNAMANVSLEKIAKHA